MRCPAPCPPRTSLRITLTVTAGSPKGREFTFSGHDTFLVGRSERAHFLVEVNPPRCRLLDLGSRNGTYDNGERVELEEFFAGHDEVERLAVVLRDGGAGRVPSRTAPGASAPCVGELGEFRLLREVGRGGMGVVYEAEQVSLRRRVALKVLPFAAVLDPRQLQRFKNEALAAAHLRHEGIVPVYTVGEERGVPYYAMQFVEGRSLAHLIAELRVAGGGPAERRGRRRIRRCGWPAPGYAGVNPVSPVCGPGTCTGL